MSNEKENKICVKQEKNFNTLCEAVKSDSICIMECTNTKTKEKEAVVCCINYTDNKKIEMVPIAVLFNTNPYELYEPPIA